MNIRITEATGIVKVRIKDLVKAARERKRNAVKPPPLWTPSDEEDGMIWVPPPEGHDPKGRNRR